MGIFSGMEQLGLEKYKDAEIIEKKKPSSNVRVNAKQVPIKEEIQEEDLLFDKHYKCPVCDKDFIAKTVRSGKLKLIGKDTDLRPIYERFDAIKYDAVACDKCGYASIVRYYGKVSSRQIKKIQDEITPGFKGINNHIDKYTYDDAIIRYKLALINTIIKEARNSERAYVCLKLAWVLRGKRLTLDENDPKSKEILSDELECIKNAFEGFSIAMASETFPIAGMDETTLKFVLADSARRLRRYDEASKYVGSILTSRTASNRVKTEALNLKEKIKEEMKIYNN